ncbi:MAG TPA: hypothetical protein VL947_10825, partial [Cytophagales bacterium]|nr:hypothetical protein [Cytophagales bacterium]
MKNALKVCIGIVLGALMAFLYFFYKGMQHNVNDTYIPKTPQLRVEVLNHASKPIQRMSIELNNKSKAEFTHLILGDRVYKNFALKGEGGVRIIVEFE